MVQAVRSLALEQDPAQDMIFADPLAPWVQG
jgi:hypothetical protein